MKVRSREQPRKHTCSQTYRTHTHYTDRHTHTRLRCYVFTVSTSRKHVLLFQLVVGGLVDGLVGWRVNWWVDGFVGWSTVWWICVVCA